LLDEHAPMKPCALVPEISAWHADDELPLWLALENALLTKLASAPFFCVAWPGAQALARSILDGVVDVRNRTVLDAGCGSGVASIAAKLAGATRVIAADVDPLAVDAALILAERHRVELEGRVVDALTTKIEADIVLAADLVYSATQLDAFRAFVDDNRERIVLADSGRPFFDACGLAPVSAFAVEVPRAVEGVTTRTVRIYRSSRGSRAP
jgi:predicted nicotinamide N-methyase